MRSIRFKRGQGSEQSESVSPSVLRRARKLRISKSPTKAQVLSLQCELSTSKNWPRGDYEMNTMLRAGLNTHH